MSEPKLMALELKPCPFCGPSFLRRYGANPELVQCRKCGVETVLAHWNTRHSATDGWQIIRTAPMLKPVIVWEPEFYQGKGTALLGIQMRDGTWRAVPNSFQIVPSHWMLLPTETAPAVKQSFTTQEGESK